MTNWLVTGGAGFIGSNFVHHLLETSDHETSDHRVVVYDKLEYSANLANLRGLEDDPRYAFVRGDICDPSGVEDVIRRHEIEVIVNFAAHTHVDRSILEPGAFVLTDVYGTFVLLDAARRLGVEHYHQIGTDEVYGQVLSGRALEDDRLRPRSPYSASKGGGDLLVHAYAVTYGLRTTVTRCGNNIGPHQYPEKVVPLFITNALDDLPLPLYGDGQQRRDRLFVRDHCTAIVRVIEAGQPGETYNVSTEVEPTNLEVAQRILDLLGKPHHLIQPIEDRPGHDFRYAMDTSKVRALGWQPHYDLERALEATVRWYIDNDWWWRPIRESGEFKRFYERLYGERLRKAFAP